MSLNLDTNVWYQVNVTKLSGYSLAGNTLTDHDGTTGGAVLVTTDTTDDAQSWQFYPYNSSAYLLRSKGSGHDSYLSVTVEGGGPSDPARDTLGDTVPQMAWYNVTEASMFWEVTPWGDGTYYLSNLANGSSWRLDALDDKRHMVLDSNITSAQSGEHFTFSSLSTIGNSLYSSYNVSLDLARDFLSNRPLTLLRYIQLPRPRSPSQARCRCRVLRPAPAEVRPLPGPPQRQVPRPRDPTQLPMVFRRGPPWR